MIPRRAGLAASREDRTGTMDLTFDIDTVKRKGVLIVVVVGELDLATSPRLDDHLTRALAGSEGKVIVDLDRVTFIDGTGISVLVRAAQTSDRFRIGPISAQVRRMFELTRMYDRLPMACCR
jgi:anti-anti-sigma factor